MTIIRDDDHDEIGQPLRQIFYDNNKCTFSTIVNVSRP